MKILIFLSVFITAAVFSQSAFAVNDYDEQKRITAYLQGIANCKKPENIDKPCDYDIALGYCFTNKVETDDCNARMELFREKFIIDCTQAKFEDDHCMSKSIFDYCDSNRVDSGFCVWKAELETEELSNSQQLNAFLDFYKHALDNSSHKFSLLLLSFDKFVEHNHLTKYFDTLVSPIRKRAMMLEFWTIQKYNRLTF